MSNRVTLAQMIEMGDRVSTIPLYQIEMLLEDVSALKSQAKAYDDILNRELARRFADTSASSRREVGKDTGTVRFGCDGYTVIADLPKKVDWDQSKLSAAVDTLRNEWSEDPAEYVDVKYNVSETKFNAWPKMIQKLFADARTVSSGKQTFKLEAQKDAA
jgi:hypothetical protein